MHNHVHALLGLSEAEMAIRRKPFSPLDVPPGEDVEFLCDILSLVPFLDDPPSIGSGAPSPFVLDALTARLLRDPSAVALIIKPASLVNAVWLEAPPLIAPISISQV